MKKLKLWNKDRYIHLDKSSFRMAGRRGFNAAPRSRPVQLSGRKPTRYEKRASGLYLIGNADRERPAGRGFSRVIEIFLYGLGTLLISLGLYNIFGKRNGEQYG